MHWAQSNCSINTRFSLAVLRSVLYSSPGALFPRGSHSEDPLASEVWHFKYFWVLPRLQETEGEGDGDDLLEAVREVCG